MRTQISTNVSKRTRQQANELVEQFGYSLRDVVSIAIDRMYLAENKEVNTMQGFYITGTKGSYIELDDGRWADSVFAEPPHDNVEGLLAELTDQADGPTFCDLSMDELKAYVGAE